MTKTFNNFYFTTPPFIPNLKIKTNFHFFYSSIYRPSSFLYEDTHNTLKYANRAKNIKTHMSKNIVSAQQHITQYTQVIGQLKKEIAALRRQLVVVQFTGIKQGNGPHKIEDDIERLLLAINEHFSDESNVRKSLYKIRQKIETLTLAISIKRNQYESLSSSEEAENLMKEIGSNQIQLKQLLVNEEVLIRRMHELTHMREVIERNVLQKQLLAEKWVTLLNRQLSCDKNTVLSIPQEGDVIRSEAEEMIKVQTSVVERLMEQIQVRDRLLDRASSVLSNQGGALTKSHKIIPRIHLINLAEEEKKQRASMVRLPIITQSSPQQSAYENSQLFTKVSRFKLPRNPKMISIIPGGLNKKNHREDKRSLSVVSQNASLSTGASSGTGLPNILNNFIIRNPLPERGPVGGRRDNSELLKSNVRKPIAAQQSGKRRLKVISDTDPLLLPRKSHFPYKK